VIDSALPLAFSPFISFLRTCCLSDAVTALCTLQQQAAAALSSHYVAQFWIGNNYYNTYFL